MYISGDDQRDVGRWGARVINSFTLEFSNHSLVELKEREKKRWDAVTSADRKSVV